MTRKHPETASYSSDETVRHEDIPVDQRKMFWGGTCHPWRRFFARGVDLGILAALCVWLLTYLVEALPPQQADAFLKLLDYPAVSGASLILLWVPIETVLLTLFGATPAKWLFGIRVLQPGAGPLPFLKALKRSFLVAATGQGFNILPIVNVIANAIAYGKLTKTGTTLWDTYSGSVVTHKKWGFIRAFICIAVSSALILLSFYLSYYDAMKNK